MALYNFQKRFVPYIQDGTKTQTIRTIRKYPQQVGKLMHLFTGLRTKQAKRIIEPPLCKTVKTIFIMPDGRVHLADRIMTEIEAKTHLGWLIFHSQRKATTWLNIIERDELAYYDGFRDNKYPNEIIGCFEIMLHWWKQTHQLPFYGHINYWK